MSVKSFSWNTIVLTIVLFSPINVLAVPVQDEILLFQEIPEVTTASRHAVSLLDSPATSSIITREDIEHMGFLNVPELLQYVVGVNFYKGGGGWPAIGIRGVNGMPNNNLLVLVDGLPSIPLHEIPISVP